MEYATATIYHFQYIEIESTPLKPPILAQPHLYQLRPTFHTVVHVTFNNGNILFIWGRQTFENLNCSSRIKENI